MQQHLKEAPPRTAPWRSCRGAGLASRQTGTCSSKTASSEMTEVHHRLSLSLRVSAQPCLQPPGQDSRGRPCGWQPHGPGPACVTAVRLQLRHGSAALAALSSGARLLPGYRQPDVPRAPGAASALGGPCAAWCWGPPLPNFCLRADASKPRQSEGQARLALKGSSGKPGVP